eukprot:g2748.t1
MMGFSKTRSIRALQSTKSVNIERAIVWLEMHQDDGDAEILSSGNASVTPPPPPEVSGSDTATTSTVVTSSPTSIKSWKCEETGKLFKSMRDVELYAERTGKSNFTETTEEVKPLSKEEIEERKRLLLEKIKTKRAERARKEKKEKIEREKMRRAAGKMERTMYEEGIQLKRKREAEMRKREKREARMALQREKKRWALQEAEKAAARAMATGEKLDPTIARNALEGKKTSKRCKEPPMVRVAAGLRILGTYSAGGEGIKAIKLLRIYVKNALEKGRSAEKFRRINMDNAHFVSRVKSLKGGVGVLTAVGFERMPASDDFPCGSLVLPIESHDSDLLKSALGAIEGAMRR